MNRQFEGWRNWATWYVATMIDNAEPLCDTKHRLCVNALTNGFGIDQLAGQFSRMFKTQEIEAKKFYKENAAFGRKLEIKSRWEEPMGEVNWREIAWSAAEEEEENMKKPRQEVRKAEQLNDKDKELMQSMGVRP